MSVLPAMAPLVGSWIGSSRLFTPWQVPAESDSPSSATVSTAVAGRVLQVLYTWSYEGKAHEEGLLLVGADPAAGPARAAWADSWHMGDVIMLCEGSLDGGAIRVRGSYAAPTGPDWGWQITIPAPGTDTLEIAMENISAAGEMMPAVRAAYRRADARAA